MKRSTEYRDMYGRLHRLDGPACIWPDGTQAWWVEGKLHRLDGPACSYANGTQEWWVHGEYIPFDIVGFFQDMGLEDADDETKIAVLRMKMAGNG